MPWGRFFAFSLFFILGSAVFAEYRAFNLKISSPDGQDFRQVVSQFDPDQYRTYYALKEGEKITYTDTWMCRGRTSHQVICPSPHAAPPDETADRAPATTNP